jgi:NAD(P)-dependent dehydrogenase (short-subunit alcohol dehydrogenase family)
MTQAFEDFSGRVAIVTGAGGGLGRAYALWLAQRGCAVVVNNRVRPDGSSTAPAVVAEIVAAGGRAVAHLGAVEDPASGPAMVELAERSFGPPDILICNAGVQRWADFDGVPLDDFRRVVDVNIWGTVYPVHAAWPGMVARGYGRVVLTSSGAGLWGQQRSADYSMAKAAMVGLARGLTLEAPADGDVRINVIAPAAYTAMSSAVVPDAWADYMSPDHVAPVVGWLCSAACQDSGMVYHAGAGRVRRVRTVEGPIGLMSKAPVEALMVRTDQRREPTGSFDAGAELMPELFAAMNGR